MIFSRYINENKRIINKKYVVFFLEKMDSGGFKIGGVSFLFMD